MTDWWLNGFVDKFNELLAAAGLTDGDFKANDGTVLLPSYSFKNDEDSGFFLSSPGNVRLTLGGVASYIFDSSNLSSVTAGSFILRRPVGSAGAPTYSFNGDNNTGIYSDLADNVKVTAGGVEAARIEDPADLAATETSLWLYDLDNATIEQVTVGATDSGGAGFKVLRIPN